MGSKHGEDNQTGDDEPFRVGTADIATGPASSAMLDKQTMAARSGGNEEGSSFTSPASR